MLPDDLTLAVAAFGDKAVGARLLELHRAGRASPAALNSPALPADHPAKSPTPRRDAVATKLADMRAAIDRQNQIVDASRRSAARINEPWPPSKEVEHDY